MTDSEINALQIEDVVETAKVVEKPKKTTTKKTVKKETTEVKEESKTEVVKETVKKPATGVVVNCYFLRLRKDPEVADNVIKEIKAGTEVEILETLDNGFSKVITKHGDEGFCMTEYIQKN